MKKKIALLLAFTMLLSIIPMNVLADAPGGQLSGLATGALWERTLGRASNIRHWTPGVLVAESQNTRLFSGNNSIMPSQSRRSWGSGGDENLAIIADAGNNLRSILASMDYFRDQPTQYATSIVMDIYNARGYLWTLFDGRPRNDNIFGGLGFQHYGYNFPANTDFGAINPGSLATGIGSNVAVVNASREQFLAYLVAEAWGNILNDVDSELSTQFSRSSTGQAIENVVPNDDAMKDSFPANGLFGKDANGNDRDALDWAADAADSLEAARVTGEHYRGVLNLLNSLVSAQRTPITPNAAEPRVNWVDVSGNVNLTNAIKNLVASFLGISANNVYLSNPLLVDTDQTGAWNLRKILSQDVFLDQTLTQQALDPALDVPLILIWFDQIDWFNRASTQLRALINQVDNVFRQDVAAGGSIQGTVLRDPLMMIYPRGTEGISQDFVVAVFPRYENRNDTARNMITTSVDLVLIRTSLNQSRTTGNNVSQARLPIEYITNGDTNSEPVYLTFNPRASWPAAGESGNRTYLTTNQDSRFTVGLYEGDDRDAATPRTFHRYGRALIPGIRISEAVQSAFDQRNWWIELKIDSPGFYWTQDTTGTTPNFFQTRFQTRYQGNFNGDTSTGAQQNANDIRPVRQLHSDVTRMPLTGNNAFTIIAFPVALEGVTNNLNRQVNDWLQINNMSIGATDRARVGDVVVDVNLYRTGQGTNGEEGWWSWHPYPLQDIINNDGTYIPAGIIGNRAFNNGPPTPNDYPQFTPNSNQATTWYTAGAGTQLHSVLDAVNDVGEFRWNRPPQGTTGWQPSGDPVFEGELVVARYGVIGLELFLHEDDNLEDFDLRSGVRSWVYEPEPLPGEIRPIGAIIPEESIWEPDHLTARVVLRELAPGSLPATGAHPTVYSFNEGIQLLGARLWANEAYFIADHDDDDAQVWFGNDQKEADNFLNASLERNQLTIRPEIGREDRRWELAEITAEFYLSVQPGYESLYGTDIEVTVSSGTVEEPFEGKLVVAHAWDPISVQTQNIVLDENDIEAVIGMVRGIDISDITITETRSGQLVVGDRIWVGLEGGISRGWGSADHVQLRAETVETSGNIQVSPIQHDSHGFFVEITRTASSADEDGQTIKFGGVKVSGRVVPNQQYNLIVADSGVAKNWEGFSWINTQQQDVGFARGIVRGFFNEEPYITPAFSFEGADVIFTPPSTVNPPGGGGTTGVTPPIGSVPVFTPRSIRESDTTYITRGGETLTGPFVSMQNPSNNMEYATTYVMFSVVADILGVAPNWNEATGEATFDNGLGVTVVLTAGSSDAVVTTPSRGTQTVPITASGIRADARIINGRMFVPVKFFDDVVPEYGVKVEWLQNQPSGMRGVLVSPR